MNAAMDLATAVSTVQKNGSDRLIFLHSSLLSTACEINKLTLTNTIQIKRKTISSIFLCRVLSLECR